MQPSYESLQAYESTDTNSAETASADRVAQLIDLEEIVEERAYASLRGSLPDIEDLAAKISQRGQLVPVLLWHRRGRFVLLSGHRRVAAMRNLGVRKVKAVVYREGELNPRDAMEIAIADNVDRNNFSKLELALLVKRLTAEGATQRQIARQLRLSNGSVSDYHRFCLLPEPVQLATESGKLALRAALRLHRESPDNVAVVLAAAEQSPPMSLSEVNRLLTGPDNADSMFAPTRTVAKKGAAWSRPASVIPGLVSQRVRDGEKQIRINLPQSISDRQRQALRCFLQDQINRLSV